jgi:hypothetical protein
MKAFAENVSVEMGFNGEITDEVLTEAQKRLDAEIIDVDREAECECCNERCARDNMTIDGGFTLCHECYNDHYLTCEHCDAITENDDCVTVDGQEWCRSCTDDEACKCDACGDYTPHDNSMGDQNTTLCMSCYENSYFFCDHCECLCSNDDYAREGYCEECWNEHKLGKIQRLLDSWDDPKTRAIRVSRDDSIGAGNCTSGTDSFIDEYFPSKYEWACVTIGEIIDTVCPDGFDSIAERDMDFAKQVGLACLYAIKAHRNNS